MSGEEHPETWAERLVAMSRLHSHALSPDGTTVAACVLELDDDGASYVGSIHLVPVAGGPSSTPLRGGFDDRQPAFAPDGTLTFTSNRVEGQSDAEPDPKTKRQVWALGPDGLQKLTDEPLGVGGYRWARQAERLFVQTPVYPDLPWDQQAAAADDLEKGPSVLHFTKFPVRHWDHWLDETALHLVMIEGGVRRDLTPERRERFMEWDWDVSEDGRTVVYTVAVDRPDRLRVHALQILDVDTGAVRTVLDDAVLDLGSPLFSPDGATIAVDYDRRRGEHAPDSSLGLVSVATGELRELTPTWDVHARPVGWSRDGGTVLATADDRAQTPLFAVDAGTGEPRRLTHEGTVHSVAIGQDALVLCTSSLRHPPGLVALDLADADGTLRPVFSPAGDVDEVAAGMRVESVLVPGSDGVPVQTFIVQPADGGHGGALLWIHGGPIGSWGDVWHWRWNSAAAVAAGWTVALPNPSGSTGFGQAFVQRIWGNVWGEACATDVLAVADALAARPDIDGNRIVAMGGSFGGYMTNWLGTQTDRFAALVTHASLWDFRAFHGVTDHPAWWGHMLGLDPWRDREPMDRYSPRAHLDGWSTPTLILHGEKDYRVPIGEALALFEALQARGVASELVVFPDENHWILKPRNIVAWYEAWLGFVERVVGRHQPSVGGCSIDRTEHVSETQDRDHGGTP